jgi:hypothetical protein
MEIDLNNILQRLDALLQSQREYSRAGQLAEMRQQLLENPEIALAWLASPAVWGSSGTVWDFSFGTSPYKKGSPDHAYKDLLLLLLMCLEEQGHNPSYFKQCKRFLENILGHAQ